MNNNGYLSEEQYRKTKKKINLIGIVLLCGGLPMAILGFVTTFIMRSDNNLFFLMFLGMPMIFIGVFLILTSHMREFAAFTAQQQIPIAQEGIEKMAPSIGRAGKTIAKEVVSGVREAKENQIKCKHCGELIDKDSTYCESCGKKVQ